MKEERQEGERRPGEERGTMGRVSSEAPLITLILEEGESSLLLF